MNKKSIIITLGILIALMPILGFPGGAKDVFFVLAGLVIALVEFLSTARCESNKNESDVSLQRAESFETSDEEER